LDIQDNTTGKPHLPVARSYPEPSELTPELEQIRQEAAAFLELVADLAGRMADGGAQPAVLHELKSAALRTISELLGRVGELPLQVCPHELHFLGHPVYSCQEAKPSLTEDLYHDGIREIQLSQGLALWELTELMELLATGRPEPGTDAATVFWERAWPHISARVLDPFEAGLLTPPGWSPGAPCREEGAPFALSVSVPHPGREVLETMLETTCMGMTGGERGELLAQVNGLQPDLWRRGLGLAITLVRQRGSGDPVIRALAYMAGEMLDEGRWGELASLGRELRWRLGPDGPAGERWQAESLRAALAPLLTDGNLDRVAERMAGASLAAVRELGALLLVLPAGGDAWLKELLRQQGKGEAAFHLLAILLMRGVDMEEQLSGLMEEGGEAGALAALAGAEGVLSARSLQVLSPLLAHTEASVRQAAMDALSPHLDTAAIPHLVALLRLTVDAEKAEMVVDLLDKQPPRPVSKHLLPHLKTADFGRLPPELRARLVRILVRADDPAASSYLSRQIIKLNLSRGAGAREEIVAAVVDVGGDTARRILEACRDQFTMPGVRELVEGALCRVREEGGDG